MILGYPRLFENQGSCVRSGPGVLSPFGLSAGSVAFLNEMGDYMNTQLNAMVTQMVQNGDPKLVFADPTAAFAGRGSAAPTRRSTASAPRSEPATPPSSSA